MDHLIPVSNNIDRRILLNLPTNHKDREEPTPSPARSFACSLDSTTPPIMFSPEASIQSARSSLRNPRRRQRKDSDGPQQQRSRKRSKLNDDSFKDPAVAHMNGNGAALMNGHAVQSPENSVVLVDMPVREKKTAPKRAPKEDTGSYLVRIHAPMKRPWLLTRDITQTKNANYSVKKLPGFPSALLRPSSTPQSHAAQCAPANRTTQLRYMRPLSHLPALRSPSHTNAPSSGTTAPRTVPPRSSP